MGRPTELVVVESPYRALVGPLLAYMDALGKQAPNRPIVVVLNEVVPRHWWENLLHNQTALRLKLRLFGRGTPRRRRSLTTSTDARARRSTWDSLHC